MLSVNTLVWLVWRACSLYQLVPATQSTRSVLPANLNSWYQLLLCSILVVSR